MFSTNTSLRHLRSYGTDLFPMIESYIKKANEQKNCLREMYFLHGIDTVKLLQLVVKADSNPDPLGISNLFYKEFFKTMPQKYRKVREAEFIKVTSSDKRHVKVTLKRCEEH